MALRRPLEAHFEHFRGLLAKWLSGGLWKVIYKIDLLGVFWGHVVAGGPN